VAKSGVENHSRRLIIRHCKNAHPHICNYFVRKHGFSDLCMRSRDSGSKTKAAHFGDLIADLIYALRNLNFLRGAKEIVSTGPMAANIALLLKLGALPSVQRVYWFGFFIHNPRWLRFLRFVFRFLDSGKIRYVLFSDFEKTLYQSSLLLDVHRMIYVPYGDMSELEAEAAIQGGMTEETHGIGERDFFFSGGYSNRDYLSLIEVFRTLPYKLVIICSQLNTEVDESKLPQNVKVLRDESSEVFDVYLKASKACIIPIAYNTGAAGQSCLLRYMKNKKIIIASDTGIIREYITDAVSGILVKNNHEAMKEAVQEVEASTEKYQRYGCAAFERYLGFFSGEAVARRLDEMLTRSHRDT
jgi:glycosyltransferase involved in cell wall biosynthesis